MSLVSSAMGSGSAFFLAGLVLAALADVLRWALTGSNRGVFVQSRKGWPKGSSAPAAFLDRATLLVERGVVPGAQDLVDAGLVAGAG